MRDSFIFYGSFVEALDELPDDIQLQVYRALSHYAIYGEEPNLDGIAKAIFALIKPQIDANNKRYDDYQRDFENGKKGAEYGKLGGRPKKENPPQKPPLNPPGVFSENPINVNVNDNVNDNVSFFKEEEKKEKDPFLSKNTEIFLDNYREKIKKPCRLSPDERIVLFNILNDLISQGMNIEEISKNICSNLKKAFESGFYKKEVGINWLLRENNFYAVLNGEFLPKNATDTGGQDRKAMLERVQKRIEEDKIKKNEHPRICK